MADDVGIQRGFARMGAKLHNVQWSVSAWTADDELVVSLWGHHYRPGSTSGTVEYADRLDRWRGPGNDEFRRNIERAFVHRRPVRLVVASTRHVEHVQAGADASKIKKSFDPRPDLLGEVAVLDGDHYVFRFHRLPT